MSDDIDVCVILAKGVHTGALTVIAVILNLPLYTRRAWSRVFASGKYSVFFSRHIWSKYAMDGYIAYTNVCLRDLDGGR